MKKTVLLVLFLFGFISNSFSQNTQQIKAKFLSDLQSGKVEDGCKVVIYVLNAAANAACYIPEPTVSKVACTAAQIMNVGVTSELDPNMPHPITDLGIEVCKLTYTSTNAGITYTFEFAKNKSSEIRKTWNWLNTLNGAIQFMYYMSN
jgi:hypothetical protein